MTDSTIEEASRCWRCHNPGKFIEQLRAAQRSQGVVRVYTCETQLCHNFGERWIVQVRPDGTIPNRNEDKPTLSAYPTLSASEISAAQDNLRNL